MTTTTTASPELPDPGHLEALARGLSNIRDQIMQDRVVSVVDVEDLIDRLALARCAQPEGEAPQAVVGVYVSYGDDAAVDLFAAAMKAKMAASRAKGRSGWHDPDECPAERLNSMLVEHLAKGDPVDVANFCMMLWNRNENTAPAAQHAESDAQAMEADLLARDLDAAALAQNDKHLHGLLVRASVGIKALAAQSQGAPTQPQSVSDERKSFDAYWAALSGEGATEAELEVAENAAWWAWQARPRHCLALPLSAYPAGTTYTTAQQAAAPGALAGYQTAPVVATKNMLHAGMRHFHDKREPATKARECYRDMLATAPSAPGTPEAPADMAAKDAARYQWLRERWVGWMETDEESRTSVYRKREKLDAWIDRAAQLDGGQGEKS